MCLLGGRFAQRVALHAPPDKPCSSHNAQVRQRDGACMSPDLH
jgi:hypothetical protein